MSCLTSFCSAESVNGYKLHIKQLVFSTIQYSVLCLIYVIHYVFNWKFRADWWKVPIPKTQLHWFSFYLMFIYYPINIICFVITFFTFLVYFTFAQCKVTFRARSLPIQGYTYTRSGLWPDIAADWNVCVIVMSVYWYVTTLPKKE